jgi:IS605 OrfB family transposase
MRTYQARLTVVDDAPLRAYAAAFSRALRSLHASRHSGTVVSKPHFMRAFGLTSRQYNAVKFSLDGMESSIVELRPGRIADLQQRIKAADKKLAKLRDPKAKQRKAASKRSAGKQRRTFEEVRAAAVRAAKSRAFKIHGVMRRRADLARRLAALAAEGRPHICFGSRKMFNAQHHLEENGFESHADWLATWQAKRDSQFFVLGSKDESGGCQGCVMTHLGGSRFALKLRLNGEAQRHISLEVSFAYGVEHLLAALKAKQAMSYRFLQDEKGWRVLVSTAVMETPICSDARLGVIGVDFNVGFVSVSETDRFGNLVASQDVPLVTAGLSKHATQTAISAAVADIIAIACKVQKPISIEYLDFAKKKAQLSYASPGKQRMLSAFAYTRFAQTVRARAHDAGIEVVEVRAAYSSKIGAQKYARRYGLSGHRAAAFVLARRGQSFPDCLKPSSRKRFATTCKDRREPVPGASILPGRLKATSGRGKARLETYARPPVTAIPFTPRGRKRMEMETSGVRGETPRCNCYASTRSGVGGCSTADFGQRDGCLQNQERCTGVVHLIFHHSSRFGSLSAGSGGSGSSCSLVSAPCSCCLARAMRASGSIRVQTRSTCSSVSGSACATCSSVRISAAARARTCSASMPSTWVNDPSAVSTGGSGRGSAALLLTRSTGN